MNRDANQKMPRHVHPPLRPAESSPPGVPSAMYMYDRQKHRYESTARYMFTETAAVSPGEEALFRLMLDIVQDFAPITTDEKPELLQIARVLPPIFPRTVRL